MKNTELDSPTYVRPYFPHAETGRLPPPATQKAQAVAWMIDLWEAWLCVFLFGTLLGELLGSGVVCVERAKRAQVHSQDVIRSAGGMRIGRFILPSLFEEDGGIESTRRY